MRAITMPNWEKMTSAIKLSALLSGRVMDVRKLKKALLTRYSFTEDGYIQRLMDVKPETDETQDQFVVQLKNYLAKWLKLSGSSPGHFAALVDLIVKEQFINDSSEELAVFLVQRGPKDMVELTTWPQQYLIAHMQQLGVKNKTTVQPKHTEQRKPTQSKPDTTQGRKRLLQCYRCLSYGHRQS